MPDGKHALYLLDLSVNCFRYQTAIFYVVGMPGNFLFV